jgi:ABC-type uncharacterized transport system permease subunit
MMQAMFLCGGIAGLAGALQVVAVYHRLIPSISSGFGFFGLMVAMLANNNYLAALLLHIYFYSKYRRHSATHIDLHLDSTLSGVLQTAFVFFLDHEWDQTAINERKGFLQMENEIVIGLAGVIASAAPTLIALSEKHLRKKRGC